MIPYNAYFAIKNVDESVSTWVPSVNDCVANDWTLLADVVASVDPKLPPHQQRVLDEARVLDECREKLTAFYSMPLFGQLQAKEQERIHLQGDAIQTYSEMLHKRIAAFK